MPARPGNAGGCRGAECRRRCGRRRGGRCLISRVAGGRCRPRSPTRLSPVNFGSDPRCLPRRRGGAGSPARSRRSAASRRPIAPLVAERVGRRALRQRARRRRARAPMSAAACWSSSSPAAASTAPRFPPRPRRRASSAGNVVKPGFDCAKAASPAEQAICAEPDLAAADAALGDLYREALTARRGDPAAAGAPAGGSSGAWLARARPKLRAASSRVSRRRWAARSAALVPAAEASARRRAGPSGGRAASIATAEGKSS